MPALAAITTFSAGLILRAEHNANWAAVRTWADNSVVHTDVAKTITVTHTFSAAQTFSSTINGQTISSAASFTGTLAVAGVATLASRLAFSTAASQITPGATSLSLRNNANNADNVLVSDAGVVTVRAGLTITAGGLTVTAGGFTVTGNSTITGNLTVTGTFSGTNNSVAQALASDFTTTSASFTNTALSQAVGANQTWKVDCDIAITCDNTGGVALAIAGPAGATGRALAMGPTSSATAYLTGSVPTIGVQIVSVLSTFNSSGGQGLYVRISAYVATAATPGNIVLQCASGVAAQTSKVLAGSTMIATRIS